MTRNGTVFQCSDKKNTNLILFILYVFYGKLSSSLSHSFVDSNGYDFTKFISAIIGQ